MLNILKDFCSKHEKRFQLATWATRMLTLGIIPFVVSVALNVLYIVDCNRNENFDNPDSQIEDQSDTEKCFYILYNIAILTLNLACVMLSLFLCIPFNIN